MQPSIIRQPLVNIDIPSYISGFVDGEGCFCVSINPRKTLKTKWEIRPSFSVSQNQDRSEVLEMMKLYFECGTMRRDYSDKTLKFEVRSLSNLVEKIIPHFEKFPLYSSKQKSFEIFKDVCLRMESKEHHNKEGIEEIIRLAQSINKGRRKYRLKKI